MKFPGIFWCNRKFTASLLALVLCFDISRSVLFDLLLLLPKAAEAAEVVISANPNTSAQAHTKLGSTLVFVDDQVGYKFFRYGATPDNGKCGYSKTTNGGTSWGTFIPTGTQTDCIGISVWYDRWTPGDTTGNFIHIVTIDTSADEMYYQRLDTSSDTLLLGTPVSACLACAGTYALATNKPSITKSTTGLIYVVTDDGNGTNIRRCTSSCDLSASWTAAGTPPQGNANTYSLLMPVASGNVMLINRSTGNVLRSSIWNGSVWSSFTTIDASAIRNTAYDPGVSATLDTSTNNIFVAYAADNDTFTVADHDIRTATYNGASWTNNTDVLTNTAGRGILQVAISRDQNNANLYVVYTVRTTIGTAATGRVYSKLSTNGMTSWGTETGPFNPTAGDLYGIDTNLMSYDRIYAAWYNATVGLDIYGETIADIAPEVLVSATGTQVTQVRDSVNNFYVGSKFSIESLSSRTLSSIVIKETGSIHAQNNLKNIKLFYEYDVSSPFNCVSESYAGTETQFGGTVTGGFSGADGTASFTVSPLALSSTSTLCVYTVVDVQSTAQNGNTIEISINNPSTDVIVSGSFPPYPLTPVHLPGTTTVVDPNLTQFGFHWRQDNGSETTASSATGGTENTALTALQIGVPRRVRIGIANQGSTSSLPTTYRLEYGVASPACTDVPSWEVVGNPASVWSLYDSPNLTNTADTTNVAPANGGVTDLPSTSFLSTNGGVRDTSTSTGSLTLTINQFFETEYSIVASTSAQEGSTYCFRMTRDGTPVTVYTHYPRATIAADVTVQSLGTQTASVTIGTTTAYLGGAFRFIENSSSRNVTSIKLTEYATVIASTSIKNVKLLYENDVSDPYNCVSESYGGAEAQFGSTAVNGFTGPGETLTITGSAAVSTTSALCVYVVFDVVGTAVNGQTLDVSIGSPSTDVLVSGGGSVGPSTLVDIASSTLIQGAVLTQTNFQWRNNNGNQLTASSATNGLENTLVDKHTLSTPIRLRLGVTNNGSVANLPTRFRLEFSPKIITCDVATVWTDVNATADGWDMYDSAFLTNSETTTNIPIGDGGVSDGAGSFVSSNGGVRDTESLSGTTTIPATDYVELEYSITSTPLVAYGTTYCFRVTSNGQVLNVYDKYAEINITPKRDYKIQRGTFQVSGTSQVITAGVDYNAPASTSKAFVRITNSNSTGSGHDSGGAAQNADDVTAYISDASNIASSFTIGRPGTSVNSTYVNWEIIEFIGSSGTDNELDVRSVGTVSFTSSGLIATGTVVSGVAANSKVVVYVTGSSNNNASRNFYAGQVTAAWDSVTQRPVFRRGASGSSVVDVSYAVVEFTGDNWLVQRVEHSYSAVGTAETESITAVNSLERTFLHVQKRMGDFSIDIVHFGHNVWLSSIGAVSFQLESGASTSTEQTSVVWVIENLQSGVGAMKVQRSSGQTTGGSTPYTESIVLSINLSAINNTSITANTRADGANTTYPRPMAGFSITSSSTYQIWRSNTSATLNYRVELVEWPVADLTIRQNYYRFYVPNNSLKPTDPWPPGFSDLGENTSITISNEPLGVGDQIRLRMTLKTSNANMPAGLLNFKLQYAFRDTTCSAISGGSWSDVGQSASSTVWRGYVATGTSDGTALSGNPPTGGDLLISLANRAGSLVHNNPSAANPFPVLEGENFEYDWHLEQNGAIPRSTYCFRVVKTDDTPLASYANYPQIYTAGFTPATQNWRWYSDELNETPTTTLAGESVAPIDIASNDTIALRVTVKELRSVQGNDTKFKLQYSEQITFANPIDVVATTSCLGTSVWCYIEGPVSDNTLITTSLLSTSDSCVASSGFGCGRHNSAPTAVTGHVHSAVKAQEYSFTIKPVATGVNVVYYFRLFDVTNGAAVGFDTGYAYPSLVTEGASLQLTVSGLPTGTSTSGVTTNITTTPGAVGFGDLTFNTDYIGAHRLSVQTNATEGYQVLQFARQQLLNSQGLSVSSIPGTNAVPQSWSVGCTGSSTGCIGYHTTDATLQNGSTRFAPTDTYSGLETTPYEIMFSSIPANDSHDIVYRIKVNELQPAGLYEAEIVYLAVPTY